MKIDLSFSTNQLFLNPRLPEATRKVLEKAWSENVGVNIRSHIGLTTSGSTGSGLGKIILLSREALLTSANAVNEKFNSTSGDIWFKSLPSFHVGGLGILLRAHLSGAGVYEDKSVKWNAAEFVRQVADAKATLVSLVPTQVFDLVRDGLRAPSSVRAVIVGGGRLENELRLSAIELGWPCFTSYGMTETCSQIATAPSPEDPTLRLLPHVEVKTNADGRLMIKSESLLTAQINVAADGHSTFADPKVSGWFLSEDHGHMKGDRLVLDGRSSDFVKIGGENVLVSRLEDRLESLKLKMKIKGDVALLSAHDERLGATLLLIGVDEVEMKALAASFNAEVAPFERIRRTEIVDSLPRSSLGKLLRAEALALVGLKPFANN